MAKIYRSASSITTSSTFSLSQLRSEFDGRVISPEGEEYDAARAIFYGGTDHRPTLIIQAVNAADVSRAIELASKSGLDLSVRSGGHSLVGHSIADGGIVLDLRNLKSFELDPESRTAWAETGLTAVEYTTAAAAHGLATGFGDTGSVGIGGITLGGGIGFLVRKHGLTIDDLLAADVVTADGKLLRVDKGSHSDLFWAIRGGGGNFGVATRFQFKLHPVDNVLGGMLILPATVDSITSFIAEAEAAPEELSAIANVMSAPPMPFLPAEVHGKIILMTLLVYAGPIDAGERAVAPFRAIAKPYADMTRPMKYPEIYPPEDPSYHPTAVSTNMFLDRVDRDDAKTILDMLAASDASLRVTQLRVLGGAMARIPADATAFAHRRSRIMANLAAFYNGPEDKAVRAAWVTSFASALRQQDTGAYVNFLGDEDPSRIRDAYPAPTLERLMAIKARYDPENLFHLNWNIPPQKDQ